MKKQKKQNILTFIIVILVLILASLIISIIYEEKINMTKQNAEDVVASDLEENEAIEDEGEDIPVEDEEEKQQSDENIQNEETEYVGEEEKQPDVEITQKSKDEKAIELAQNEWGDDDTVSFNVEEKKGDIYYVAVKSEAAVIQWYEIDTVTWEISEYY